jgi:hypothetical protein
MKLLRVTTRDKEYIAQVDDEDFERLSKFHWHLGGSCITRYRGKDGIGAKFLSNEVMQLWGVKFDHKDRSPFNNQKSNLRIATSSQNQANVSKTRFGTSKYKGVHWDKKANKWRASIRFNWKLINLGYFLLEQDAAKAYNEKAKELFGEFAWLNPIC